MDTATSARVANPADEGATVPARPVPAIPVIADPAGPVGTAGAVGTDHPDQEPSVDAADASRPAAGCGTAGHTPLDPGGAQMGFAPEVSAKLRSYVYLLVDSRTGRVFYVGRGRGDRCFRHVRAARLGIDEAPGAVGEHPKYPMLDRIREIERGGRPVRIEILRYGLSAAEAMLVEAATGDALGIDAHQELGSQRRPVAEVSSSLAKRAKFKRAHQVVLLRVGGTGADPSYEMARHSWRIGRRWIDPDAPRSPRWAVIVVGDLVGAVYRIDSWDPADPADGGRRPVERYSFLGTPDPELEARYVGKSVAAYLGTGSQGPVTYVWCGPHWVNTAH